VKRILVLVEGQTEETFVNTVLAPHLWGFEKAPEVTRVVTKLIEGRRAHRGGGSDYRMVEGDVRRLLASSPAAVTTLFDYHQLRGFPGQSDLPSSASCHERVAHIERAFAASIGDARFLPNLVLHEFEGLLFAGPTVIAEVLLQPARAAELESIAAGYASPEEIDGGPETHPARRIERILPGYEKVLHGPQIAARITLAGIRARCPHFHAWLTHIEGL
jgi:Domain of unknown function (DUF4276)